MPRGRILLKSISQSKKLPQLQTDSARLLYTWLLAHLDINGCFYGDVETVKSLVFTRLKKTEKQIEEWLEDLAFNKLIIRFQDNGDDYLFVPDFVDKQPHLRADHEAKPLINDFNPTKLQPSSNQTTTKLQPKQNSQQNHTEGKLQPNYNQTTEFDGTSKVKESKVKESKDGFFNLFWKAYPYKKSIGQAEKAWKKINPDEGLLTTMLSKIEKAKKSKEWLKDNGEYIPHPATWLNAKVWEDEDLEVTGGQTQGTRMACKKCGDNGQYAGIDESGLCTSCRIK